MESINLISDLSNCYGAPGFEDNVLEVIRAHCGELSVERDSMMNCYLNLSNRESSKPTIMLDAHLDEVGFMVQSIDEKGLIHFIPLGGWIVENIPAHLVMIKNTEGHYIKGIVTSKPPHFMTAEERLKKIEIRDLLIDVGASSREEVLNSFKINVAAPIVPYAQFEYNAQNNVMMGKAFDNRLGCAAVVNVLKNMNSETLDLNIVGALATQEEVGTRGAEVTARRVKPDVAIVFEGTPADDGFRNPYEIQAGLHLGPQIRHRDNSYISHHRFITFAERIAQKHSIKIQHAVRSSGGTNAGKIHLANHGIPTLVIGIPTRYIHSHYGYASYRDYKSAVELATLIIRQLNTDTIESF